VAYDPDPEDEVRTDDLGTDADLEMGEETGLVGVSTSAETCRLKGRSAGGGGGRGFFFGVCLVVVCAVDGSTGVVFGTALRSVLEVVLWGDAFSRNSKS